MSARFQTYLFDWDGTLADTLNVWLHAYQKVFKSIGKQISDKEIGQEVMGDLQYWQKKGLTKYMDVVDNAEEGVLPQLERVQLVPGAVELLKKLHSEGAKLGVVTTSYRNDLEVALNHLKLNSYFSTLVCGDEVQFTKPNPEPVLKALQNLAADPQTAVIVGDTEKDILAGKAAGIHTILLQIPNYHDLFYKQEIILASEPEQIVHSLAEVE